MLVQGCKTTVTPSQSTQQAYKEDLSDLRPSLPEIPPQVVDTFLIEPNSILTGSIEHELDSVVSLIAQRNEKKRYWDGYTVQVYAGLSRELAYLARTKIIKKKMRLVPRLEYHQPNYKVKVGAYFNKLEAYGVLQDLKSTFPQALLLPEKLKLKK